MSATRAAIVHKPIRTMWCDVCQLSTIRTVHVWALTCHGVTDLGEVTYCTRCAQRRAAEA